MRFLYDLKTRERLFKNQVSVAAPDLGMGAFSNGGHLPWNSKNIYLLSSIKEYMYF